MSLPKYNELYSPFLAAIQDGMPHNISKVKDAIAEQLQLSEESLAEQLPSGTVAHSPFLQTVSAGQRHI